MLKQDILKLFKKRISSEVGVFIVVVVFILALVLHRSFGEGGDNKFGILNEYYGILTITGWFLIYLLNSYGQKKNLKNKARMKIYEELYNYKKELDDICIELGISLSPFSVPFLEMGYADRSVPSDKIDLKALEIWRKYLENFNEKTSLFVSTYLKLWIHFKMWISTMPELSEMYKDFFEVQLAKLTKDLDEYHNQLQDLSIKNPYWKTWDQKEIRKKSEELSKKFDEIAVGYLDDFMIEIHNCLIVPILENKIIPRTDFKNLPERYKILTKNGIKEVVRRKKVKSKK